MVNKRHVTSSNSKWGCFGSGFLTGSAVITSPMAFIQAVMFSLGTRGWLKGKRTTSIDAFLDNSNSQHKQTYYQSAEKNIYFFQKHKFSDFFFQELLTFWRWNAVCPLYLFNTTLSRALPTSFPGTAKAISSTHVTCRAWAAGLGNSLNLQSQLGKGPGDFPAIGEKGLRRANVRRQQGFIVAVKCCVSQF